MSRHAVFIRDQTIIKVIGFAASIYAVPIIIHLRIGVGELRLHPLWRLVSLNLKGNKRTVITDYAVQQCHGNISLRDGLSGAGIICQHFIVHQLLALLRRYLHSLLQRSAPLYIRRCANAGRTNRQYRRCRYHPCIFPDRPMRMPLSLIGKL